MSDDLFTGFVCSVCNAEVPPGQPHGEAHCCGNLQRRIWELEADNEQAWESRAHWCVEAGKAMKERDEAQVEVVDLRGEVARQKALHQEILERSSLIFREIREERDEARAEVVRLRERLSFWTKGYTREEVEEITLTADRLREQRDEARREVERLQEQAHQDAILALEAQVRGKG